MKLLKKLTAIIILLSMLITLNSPIISYAEGETGTNTTGGTTTGEQTEEIGTEYEIKEEETWDISKNGDGSVIAKWTFDDKTITISGSGEMRDWNYSSNEDWHNNKYKKIIEKVKIEDGVTTIGQNAFYECSSLTGIDISNSVISIGDNVFYRCSSLENITVEENNLNYMSIDGILFNKDETEIKRYPLGKNNKSYVIPNSVVSIGKNSFDSCESLEYITIPNSVTSIGTYAFSRCSSLTSIEIPNSITSIGWYTFYGCSSLKSVIIPDSVTTIDYFAFSGCSSLNNIEIPNSVTSIGHDSFNGCSSLTNIEIPSSITRIGNRTFYECKNLTSIEIPNSVTSIEDSAFSGCSSLTNIVIPNSVTSIGKEIFYACISLENINVEENNKKYISTDGILYNKDKTKIIHYPVNNSIKDYIIPSSITSIGNRTFYECKNLTSIDIPNSVTSIGNSAFSGCSSLTNIEIPSSVTSIGNSAFFGCSSLTNIEIPNRVTSIEDFTFIGCNSLKSISIPNTVVNIGDSAFRECNSLISINIPEGVVYINKYVFCNCYNLKNINIPNSVTSIGADAFSGCSSLTNINIPNSVTSIGYRAFAGCSSLTNIEILDSVSNIGLAAFYGCKGPIICITNSIVHEYCENNKIIYMLIDNNTSNITTEYRVKEEETWDISKNSDESLIAKWTLEDRTIVISGNGEMRDFRSYSGKDWYKSIYQKIIEKVEIRDGVTSIGGAAFHGCSNLKYIEIPNSVTKLEWGAFEECISLENIEIPNGVMTIGASAFRGCSNLVNLLIPKSVTNIYTQAFEDCSSLKKINVDEDNEIFSSVDEVLFNKDLTNLIKYPEKRNNKEYNIPNSVTNIEEYAFSRCSSLTSIEIPNSVTSIGDYAFSRCSSLTSINIPKGVISIGRSAFYNCSSLTGIEIPSGVKNIYVETFSGCSSLKSINIPNSLTSISYRAFFGCRSLTSINIPKGVISIGSSAFYNCSGLKSIEIPSEVKDIYDETFSGCSSLTSIEIPNSVTSIGADAFLGCSSLTSIEIPNSVTSIGDDAFLGCSSLENINVEDNNQNFISIDGVLYNKDKTKIIHYPKKSSIKDYIIPNSITSIGDNVFSGCSNLRSVTIPNSVTSIGQNAFNGCNNLNDIILNPNITSIGNKSFYDIEGPIICKRDTEAHRYAEGEKIGYVLDERMPKVTNTPSKFEKAQKQVVVKIDVTDITGVEEDNIKYLWSTKEEVTKEEVNNSLTNGQELSSPTGKTGTYYIYVYAKDKFGNEGVSKSSPIKLDNTAPTIELAENKYYQKPNIQDENPGTVVLTKDGNKVETYKYGETIFGEGTYEITATDEAGNSTTKEFVLQKIPTGEEGLNYDITPSELTNQDVTLNVSKKDATNTELEIELSTDGKNYEVGNTKAITENGKVYARLGKEGAYGEAIEIEITNIDKKAPVIEGVKDKRTYANKATPKAVDENLESVKLEKEGQEVVGYENGTTITELGTYKITATDKVGNKTEVEFYIKDIPSTEEVVEYTVSPEGLTNQDVKVSVTKKENEEYQDLIVQMSTDGENYEAVTEKTITENGTVYIRIVKEEEGNTVEGEVIEVEIKNIDKTAPEAQVAYSNKELTKENVTATITTNEEIQEVEGWIRGEDRKQLTKEYSQNKTEEITVKDLAGNSTKVAIEITNIDKTAPEGQVTYSETNPTNKNVTATITANEEIQEVEGWTISQDKKKLTKEYNENKTEKVIIKDKIGNVKEVEVKVLNIDRTAPLASVNYSTKNKTNKNVTVTITANEKIQGITGWTLSSDKKKLTKEYSANKTETITIKDLAGNTSNVAIEITNIDKTAPAVNVEYSTTNLTNQNVTVTITANEEIQGITGWTLSNNKKTLTKIYQNNVEETIQVKDLAGNTADKNISIRNIDKTKPEIAGVENANSYNDSVIITVTDTNPGTLLLEKDGEKVEGYTNGKEVIEEGTYKLTAIDKLGNTTIVNFTIKYNRGDLNTNNNIDTGDVLALLRYIAQNTSKKVAERHPDWNFNEKNKIIGDVNRNGKIDTGDVLTLQRYQAAKSSKIIAEKHPEWLNIE